MARHKALYIVGKLASTNNVVQLSLHTALPATKENRIDLKYARDTQDSSRILLDWQYDKYASTQVWQTVDMDAADTEFACDTVERWVLSNLKPVSLFL